MNKLEGSNEEIINAYIYGTKKESIEELYDWMYVIIPNLYEDENIKIIAERLYFEIEAEACGYILSNKIGGIVGEGTIQNCYNTVKANGGIIARVTGNIIINNWAYLSRTAEKGIVFVDSGIVTREAKAITTIPNPLEILNAGQEEVWILDENEQPTLKD